MASYRQKTLKTSKTIIITIKLGVSDIKITTSNQEEYFVCSFTVFNKYYH